MPKLRNTPPGNKQLISIRMADEPQEAGPQPMVPSPPPMAYQQGLGEGTGATHSFERRYQPQAGRADRHASNVVKRQ